MTTSLPWWEDLERLREEQNPGKYNPTQPVLRLPIPVPTMPMKDIRVNPEDESQDRGVVYLDM